MTDTVEVTVKLYKYKTDQELPQELGQLLHRAKNATHRSYAPYSDFYVGAAVLLENGDIIEGNNQENIAFPSGLCAERVALFYAKSQFPNQNIKAIAITARSKNGVVDQPVTPCGGCRQVMIQYEQNQEKPITVILSGEKGEIFVSEKVSNFMPFMFDSELVKSSEK